jgi:hypothetical protein
MKYLKLLIAGLIIFNLSNCSTISINKQAANLSSITVNKTYQVRVRSGNLAMDKLIFKTASAEFGKYLRMHGEEPFNTVIDIVFMSKSRKGFAGASNGYVNNVLYGNSWYTGSETFGYQSMDTEIASGGPFTWQNSTMIVTIKELEGKVLWDALYNYKGDIELSRLYVSTADEAAMASLVTIIKLFEKDFIIVPSAENRNNNKKPGIALIIERQKSPESQKDQITEETITDKK